MNSTGVALPERLCPAGGALDGPAGDETTRRRAAAKKFLRRSICGIEQRDRTILKLFNRPVVMESLRRFVETDDPMKHLPVAERLPPLRIYRGDRAAKTLAIR
jgi:hypothetical protein